MTPDELERTIHRSLRDLPAVAAPDTLLPRVMGVVRSRPASAPTAGWRAWPLAWQIGSVAAVVTMTAAMLLLWPSVERVGADLVQPGALTALLGVATALVRAGATLAEPVVAYVAGFVVVMSAACATAGVALRQIACGGASLP